MNWVKNSSDIGGNKHPLILKELSPIILPHLSKIKIFNNQIESIEGIARIYLPALQHLDLGIYYVIMKVINNIHQITELKKTYWPHFE